VNADDSSIGVYAETSNNAEASRILEITANEKDAELYAAVMWTIAPDKQNSIMLNRYDKQGEQTEHYITFKNKAAAINFVVNRKLYGADDISLLPGKNQVLLLDFGGIDHAKIIQDHGQNIKSAEQRKVTAKFITKDEYGGIIQEGRDSFRGHDRTALGQKFNTLFTLASKRLKE
jgi:hypothetical protein